MTQIYRVALLMGQDIGFNRDVLRGIRAYATDKKHWVFRNGPPEPGIVGALREWRPHGIIAHLFLPATLHAVRKLKTPVIDTACTLANINMPVVDVDHQAVGRIAAEHFLERRFEHFGFFGSRRAHYVRLREASFRKTLAQSGHTVSSCYAEYLPQLPTRTSWKQMDERVHRWLACLPKPVAIFASNDTPARDLADMCWQLGFDVPHAVAVLGVDNDDLECELAHPPLSSIAIPGERIGYEAAHLLDRAMSGKPVSCEPRFLPPGGVVTRQSTDILAIDDIALATALRFIRDNVADDITVDAVAHSAALSRRMLEFKFRMLLGRTVLQEIHRARIESARELLTGTKMSMPAIAARSGFANSQRLAVVFHKVTGMTPTECRRQMEGGSQV